MEVEIKIIKIKNSLDRFNRRPEQAEESANLQIGQLDCSSHLRNRKEKQKTIKKINEHSLTDL